MKRLVSLDFFRGLTIALMIVVNMPGTWNHVYPPLRHAEWHGMTPTDLVFPFFLFIVGVSIALAYTKIRMTSGIDGNTYRKIFVRTLKIFVLGLFLALFPDFNFGELRVAGVLQRIAIVFLACAILFLRTGFRTQVLVGAVLLIGYWLTMIGVPVPEIGSGMLEPGQNLAAFVDKYLLPGRMYQVTWDPEGVYSTLPAVGTGITGLLAGHLIINKTLSHDKKIIWLFFAGFTSMLLGHAWSWVFPLNKHLWTSSYVLVSSGLAAMFLAASIWIIDEKGYKKWTFPAVVFGMNAISAYVLHGIMWRLFDIPVMGNKGFRSTWVDGLISLGIQPELVSFSWALFYTFLCYLFALWLYRKRIFIKL